MFSLSFKIVMNFASLLDEDAGGMWVQRSSSRLLRKNKKIREKVKQTRTFSHVRLKIKMALEDFLKIYIFGYFLPAFDTSVV